MLDDAGIWSTGLWTSVLVVVAYAVILWLASVVWVAGDIQRRTNSTAVQFAAIAFTAVFFLPGLVLYVALRPSETIEERAERRMEMQALAAHAAESPSCRDCYRTLRADFVRCPYCASYVGAACPGCERLTESAWVVCPYCGLEERAGRAAASITGSGAGKVATQAVPVFATIMQSSNHNGHAPER